MLTELCNYLHNWFNLKDDMYYGVYTIENGKIALPFLTKNQYFRVIGSVLNDGVYQYNDELSLQDETFDGSIWAMRVPQDVIRLSIEISDYNANNKATQYSSESFGGYSYSKDIDTSWQNAFETRLRGYKKI